MKKYIGFTLIALAAAAACTKEQNIPGAESNAHETKFITFTASTDQTKTSLGENYAIIWSSEDNITVFPGENAEGVVFEADKITNGGHTATFTGTTTSSDTYYALSPAQTGASIADGKISAVLPSSQSVTEGSFDPAAALSVSTASNYVFNFKNIGALVGFTAGQDDLTGIKLEAIGGEALSGTAVVNPADGTLVSKSGESYVQMNGPLVNGSTYYFVVLPGTYAEGFRITLYKSGEFTSLSKSGSQIVERNGNLELGSLSGSKWKTAFYAGENVKIKGSAEDGQNLAYVASNGYWNSSITYSDVDSYPYNYEIFTRLSADQKFYFEADGGEKFTLDATGSTVGHLSRIADAAYSASEDGVYRIRMVLPSGAAEVKKITEVKYDIYGLDSRIFTYQGGGVWKHENFLMRTNSYKNRYRFIVKFTDDTKQYYGRHSSDTGNPTYGTTAPEYYYIQPSIDSDSDHWSPCFKFQSDYEGDNSRFYCTMTLSFNNDGGHYTHSISNIWDKQNPIATGEDMTIQGSAVTSPDVAGQKMRYSTAFYNNYSGSNSGDRADASPAGYDYEIYTKLSRDTKFYFSTASGHHLALTSDGSAVEGIFTESDVQYPGVSSDGVYRIRINSSTKEAALLRAESVQYLQPDRGTATYLNYQGNGVWMNYVRFGWTHPNAWGNDARYMFKFQIYFNEKDIWQKLGRYETEKTYTSTHLQPVTDSGALDSWNNFLTAEGSPVLDQPEYLDDYGWCNLYLKLNSEGYTYEITSIRK